MTQSAKWQMGQAWSMECQPVLDGQFPPNHRNLIPFLFQFSSFAIGAASKFVKVLAITSINRQELGAHS